MIYSTFFVKKTNQKRRSLIALIISVSVLLLLGLSVFLQPFRLLQLKFADTLYSPSNPTNNIVIVDIDDKTVSQQVGLGDLSTWSRANYARAISEINKHAPSVIGIDVIFAQDRDMKGDNQLINSLELTTNPILSVGLFPEIGEEDRITPRFLLPFDTILALKNVSLGIASIIPDRDDKARRITSTYSNEISHIDTLSVAIVKAFDRELIVDFDPTQDTYINFFSNMEETRFERISFFDLYNGTIDSEKLDELIRGKIVLIGASAKIVGDSYFTPTSGKNPMPGVEIHANAVQTILEGKFLREMSLVENILLIALICIGAGFLFMFTRIRWSLLGLVGFIAGYTLLAPVVFGMGLIVDVIHPYLAVSMVFVGIYLYRYLTEFKAKNELRFAFSKYVNPEIVSQIMDDPEKLKLGGEQRKISVLFTDIAHFTSISESLKPESLVALLNEYLDAMTGVIMEAGGTVDKFEGDAIMAFFGAPLEQEDHAKMACEAALNMRLRLVKLLDSWKENSILPGGENKPAIDFRCGINTGEAIVGNIGAKDHLNYTALGDSVNLASRLEGANKQYGTNLMISEFTANLVRDKFVFRELDLIKVVGKETPVRVYELLGRADDMSNEAQVLLNLYNKGIGLYHERKFEEGMHQFEEIIASFPTDGPSKLYAQRCEILRNFPPDANWNGVFEMRSK